jgi:hypothetical protein
VKASTHMGLDGTILTMAASPISNQHQVKLRMGNNIPDLMNLGEFSMDFPVRRSIFSKISENLQAMWAVWQSKTGA